MSLNKEIIFGLSSLGDDAMMFSDFSRKLADNTYDYTATEDGYLVVNYLSTYASGSVSVDGVIVTKRLNINNSITISILYMYIPKGSVIKSSGDMRFTVYGLKKGGS